MDALYCGTCGRSFVPDESFCPRCGSLRETAPIQQSSAITFVPSPSPTATTLAAREKSTQDDQQLHPARPLPVQESRPQRKGTGWVLAVISLGLLLVGGIALYVFWLRPASTGPTPQTTLDALCYDVQHQRYTAAYQRFSASFQQEVSLADFTRYFTGGSSCTYSTPQFSRTSATTQLTTTLHSGQKMTDELTLSRQGNGIWIIQVDPTLSTPARTLTAVCTALLQQQYHTAYTLFSSSYQQAESEQTFTKSFAGTRHLTACRPSASSDSGTQTVARMSVQRADNSQEQDTITLTQDATNQWKIENVQVYTL